MISAVILAKNAEKTIGKTLRSLGFCAEKIVIDDESTDRTAKIAKKFGTRVEIRPMQSDFARQRNYALTIAKGEWVLFIDADEYINPELKEEIETELARASAGRVGFYFKRQDIFLGKQLHFGETAQIKLLRLARKNAGIWEGRVHEVWRVGGETKLLKNVLIHNRDITIDQFIDRLIYYARMRGRQLYEVQTRESYLRIALNPLGKFLLNYIWRLGFLDGFAGLSLAWLMSWHSLLVRIWLQLYWRNHGQEIFIPKTVSS